jgi:hypothetical protein
MQFACAGNSGISHVLCNANTYRSIHEGLFFNTHKRQIIRSKAGGALVLFVCILSLYYIYNWKLKKRNKIVIHLIELTNRKKVLSLCNLHAQEILGFLTFCVMQTPTGLFMKDYSSTLALHWTLSILISLLVVLLSCLFVFYLYIIYIIELKKKN